MNTIKSVKINIKIHMFFYDISIKVYKTNQSIKFQIFLISVIKIIKLKERYATKGISFIQNS